MERIWIAGPCAVESREQLLATETMTPELKAFVAEWKDKPGNLIMVLHKVQQTYGVPACVEVMSARQLELCAAYGIRTVWVGARTCVNPTEVQQIADAVQGSDFTVLVKNPMIPDLRLWEGNIERFLKAGIRQVMAVHRGFTDAQENIYRNAPVWQIPIDLKVHLPELPILCDPSHLCGQVRWIPQVAQLAMNYGFNGLMIECHHNPAQALSDAEQQLTPAQWAALVSGLDLRANAADLDLVKQRSLLENVDNQLSELLYQRMVLVDEIAEIKKAKHIAVVQPKQWQEVVKRYQKHPEDTAYQKFLEKFLELLHQASIERQH